MYRQTSGLDDPPQTLPRRRRVMPAALVTLIQELWHCDGMTGPQIAAWLLIHQEMQLSTARIWQIANRVRRADVPLSPRLLAHLRATGRSLEGATRTPGPQPRG